MSGVQEAERVIVSVCERTTVVAMVRARLQRSDYAAVRSITCEFHEGVLTLRGRVPSYYLKQVAQELVRGTDRVSEVNNRVNVDPPTSPDDDLSGTFRSSTNVESPGVVCFGRRVASTRGGEKPR